MTEPYTAEELPEAIDALLDFAAVHEEVEGEGLYNANDLPDLARLAATLREYERVVKENAALRAEKERMVEQLEQERRWRFKQSERIEEMLAAWRRGDPPPSHESGLIRSDAARAAGEAPNG